MNIRQTVDYILEHPFTKEALSKYQKGDDKDLRHLLSEIHIHTYFTTTANSLRCYTQNKRVQPNILMEHMQSIPPPVNLAIKLPIPPKIETPVCKVIVMKIKIPKGWCDPKQLELEFQEKRIKKAGS